jgi:hypothetical protein
MKRLVLSLAAASAVLAGLPAAASAQAWQPINQREANLERRIDQGVRSGELNRAEAARVRTQLRDLERLEAHYRRTGGRLDRRERADLDRQFDRLSQVVYAQKHDRQDRRHDRY